MIKKKLKTNINSSAILKFPELDDKFDELENRIQANTTSLSGLSEKVDGIQENVEQNEQELHNLNTNAALKNQENTFTNTNTFNGAINVPNPTSDNNATNKHYVDNLTNGIQTDISTNYLSIADATNTYVSKVDANSMYGRLSSGISNDWNSSNIFRQTPQNMGTISNAKDLTTKEYVDGKIKERLIQGITFTRQQKPTQVGANKYWYNLTFSYLGFSQNTKIVAVNLQNRAYDDWNGHFVWYWTSTAIALEIWCYENETTNSVNNLKNQQFKIWYME